MRNNLKMSWAILATLLDSAFVLNPIHESSYSLLPRGKFASPVTLSVGALMQSQNTDVFEVPLSLTLEATPRFELGAGLKTAWGGSDDHVTYLVFGAKYLTVGQTSVQADLLVGATRGYGKGFALSTHHRFGYSPNFFSRLTGRVGFMDAIVQDDALMAFELGFYPTLAIVRPLSLELGLITSSQTSGFNENFALDLQPALQVHIGRESVVETAVAVGLAGEHREELRVKLVLIYAF